MFAVLRDQAGQAGNYEGGGDGVEAEAGVELGDGLTVSNNNKTGHDQQQSSHGSSLLLAERDPPDDPALQDGHDDSNKEEHPTLNISTVSPVSLTTHDGHHLLHRGEVEPDVREEGEGELHARVEKQIYEVGQAYLLQLSVLLLIQIGETGKPGEERERSVIS